MTIRRDASSEDKLNPKKSALPTFPPLSKSQRQLREAVEDRRKENPLPLSPCVEQTKKDIEAYYRKANVGDVAVVRHTQGGLLRYVVTDVEGPNPKRGRIDIRGAGAFYMKSGANCFHPKGQTTLVMPTDVVLAWAAKRPNGELDVSIFRVP